jgi:hypothetical protein
MSDQPQGAAGAVIEMGGKQVALADALRTVQSSASWFWWVAGLSLINSVGAMFDSAYGMVLGLGITQMIDAIFLYGADGASVQPTMAVRGIHLALVLAIAGVFVALGVFAKRHSAMAFVVGMALYLADALIYVVASDWIGVGFHAFVLFMLWGGYATLRAIQASAPTAVTEA